MPRCFMAKKLKSNLYEQWKQEQQQERSTSEAGSRSPSPTNSSSDNDHLERSKELASTASLEAARKGHDFTHNGGKWCFVSRIRFYGHRLRSKIGRTLDYCRNFFLHDSISACSTFWHVCWLSSMFKELDCKNVSAWRLQSLFFGVDKWPFFKVHEWHDERGMLATYQAFLVDTTKQCCSFQSLAFKGLRLCNGIFSNSKRNSPRKMPVQSHAWIGHDVVASLRLHFKTTKS